MSERLLLDTCAAIWLMSGSYMDARSRSAIRLSAERASLFVSPFTAWEVALLAARGRSPLLAAPFEWYESLMNVPGIRSADIDAKVLMHSHGLPGMPPSDPADRVIIATARDQDLILITRDRKIIDYAAAGHVRVMEC